MKDLLVGKIIVVFLTSGIFFNAAIADAVKSQNSESQPYLVRGQEVTKLFQEYEQELNQLYTYLDERVREIDPELHHDLEEAQLDKEKTGYQVVPKIRPKKEEQPSRKAKRPKPNHFSWPICERAIRDEMAKLEDVNIQIADRSANTKVEKKDFIVKLAKQFITLKTTWRKIQRWINYNKVWQGKVASGKYEQWYRDRTRMIDQVLLRYDLIELLAIQDDQLFFDKASTLVGLGANANRDALELTIKDKIAAIDHAIWTRTKFTKLPSSITIKKKSANQTELIVPLYTDILDEGFLTQFIDIIESHWQAKIETHHYSVHVNLLRISPADLYENEVVPQPGQQIDEKEHAARFPKWAALTTGGRYTYSIGSVIILGPKEISDITLAHEFGHFLSFKDRYFRGYEDLGDDGYDLFEIGTNPDDIMSHPGSGKVLPQHFREIMDAVEGKNLTADEYVNLSLQHFRQGDYANSLAESEKALKIDPDNFAALNNACVSNIKLKQWDQAISTCEKAISLNPNSVLARNNLAWARKEKDKGASQFDGSRKSCISNRTPYQLKIPLGLEEDYEAYIPKDNPLTVEKVELGKLLFFDTRLSRDNTISCASCHKPELAWTDGTKLSMGIDNQLSTRNGMTIINRLYGRFQLWHGKTRTLEEQAANPLTKPVRMGMPSNDAEVAKLNAIQGYRERFQKVFCSDVTMDGIKKAIAAFERTLLSGNSPADRYDMGGEENVISESAKRGLKIFQTKGRCTRCHSGFNFSDEEFHNLGIDWDTASVDLGRYSIDHHPGTIGGFKTPTLRDVAHTAPYMHDGRFSTLEEVVDFYDKGGIANPHLSNLIIPLGLTPQEKKDLVEYMLALNGEGWQVEPPTRFPE